MTNDMYPASFLEIWISGNPQPEQLVRLEAYRLDHLLPMLRHEERNVEEDLR